MTEKYRKHMLKQSLSNEFLIVFVKKTHRIVSVTESVTQTLLTNTLFLLTIY